MRPKSEAVLNLSTRQPSSMNSHMKPSDEHPSQPTELYRKQEVIAVEVTRFQDG